MTTVKGAATPAAPARPAEPANYPALREAATTAAHHAHTCGIHVPEQWTGTSDGHATARIDDNLRLVYIPGRTVAPNAPGTLTALSRCPEGHSHTKRVDTAAQLTAFRHDLTRCPIAADQPKEHPHGQ
ncbi:hypothetical protein ACH4TX_42155 [Streptomyces sp. NPDC021098]|uniref:hypothetical protein n=1 Tax=unclassified Streptomyces TaxID=2593676 RepID=UPI0037AC6F07